MPNSVNGTSTTSMPRIGHSEIVLYLPIKLIIEAEDMKITRAKVSVPIQNHRGDPALLVFFICCNP